jgi:hypothetical protein
MRGGALSGVASKRPGALALLSAVVLLCAVVTCSHAIGSMDGRARISADDLEKLINRPNTTVVHGTLDLGEDQIVDGNVVVIEGDLEMQSGSAVHGDAIVIAGDALLNGQCTVDGDLRIVAGFYYASDLAKITGKIIMLEGNYTLKEYDESTGHVELQMVKDVNRHRLSASVFPGPFNRVDGQNFDFSIDYKRPEGVTGSSFEGLLRIPTEDTHDKFVQFRGTFSTPLMGERMKLDVEGFKITGTQDSWRTGDFENSIIAFFVSNDDRDYYEKTGGSAKLSYNLMEEITVTGSLSSAEYRSLATRSPFTLFQRTDFRPNPPVFEGHLTELDIGVVYDTRFDVYFPSDAWFVDGGVRSGLDFMDGEATYTILEGAVRRHQKLARGNFLDLRFKFAGATDALPPQRTFSFGSFGGVRGKDWDSWSSPRGDRLLLGNVEYRRRLSPVRFVRSVFTSWWFVAFYDAGALFLSDDPKDFGTLFSDAGDHAGSGAGLGVSGSSFVPYLGFFVAKDLDTDSWRFIVRLNRPF